MVDGRAVRMVNEMLYMELSSCVDILPSVKKVILQEQSI